MLSFSARLAKPARVELLVEQVLTIGESQHEECFSAVEYGEADDDDDDDDDDDEGRRSRRRMKIRCS